MSGAEPGEGVICHAAEIAEILQALPRPPDRGRVEGVALGQPELAPDDLVLRPGVALDVDALDVHARPLAHVEHEIDRVLLLVARDAGLDLDKGIAAVLHVVGDRLHRPLDRVSVVPITGFELHVGQQLVALQLRQLRVDRDLADLVALALVQREG